MVIRLSRFTTILALFPGSPRMTKSWVGPGNEAITIQWERENFEVLWLFAIAFSVKFGGMAMISKVFYLESLQLHGMCKYPPSMLLYVLFISV